MIKHYPGGNRNQIEVIRHWQPVGSNTVLWLKDMESGRLLHMFKWGKDIYFPVYDGLRFGICVHNGNSVPAAYPAYIEGTTSVASKTQLKRQLLRLILKIWWIKFRKYCIY